jgi:hypothetical protein
MAHELKGLNNELAAIALTRLQFSRRPTPDEVQRGIDQAMRDTMRCPPDNFQRDANQTPPSRSQEEPRRGTGWVDARPIESPPGQDRIKRLVNEMLPHGKGSKAG